jgi:transposase-like protein
MPKKYDSSFKMDIMKMVEKGKKLSELSDYYKIPIDTIRDWKRQFQKNGRFRTRDSLTEAEKSAIEKEKKKRFLAMSKEILSLPHNTLEEKRTIIKKYAGKYTICELCSVLNIQRGTFYYQKTQNSITNIKIYELINNLVSESKTKIDNRKIKIYLMDNGYNVNLNKISRIIKRINSLNE